MPYAWSRYSTSPISASSLPWRSGSIPYPSLPTGVDVLEDASVNFLILLALAWSARARARLGMALAVILLVPGLATIWTAWHKFILPQAPAAMPMTLTGLGALAINLACAFMLARFKEHSGSLSRAAFFSARNDVLANIGIIAAAGITAIYPSGWPDLLVGLVIAWINLDAAKAVYTAAKAEHAQAHP